VYKGPFLATLHTQPSKELTMEQKGSWLRAILMALGIPILLALFSNFVIPNVIQKSNKAEALRTSRLQKALDIRSHNEDFTIKLHRLKTMMQTFNKQNVRRRLSASQLTERQNVLQKDYTERYLTLDETAWWWYWDLERDAEIYKLLSPGETKKLVEILKKYGDATSASVGAIDPVWDHLSSSDYSLSKNRQDQLQKLEEKMNTDINRLFYERANLEKEMSTLFAQSTYEPDN
jgi:hypothetical protein